MVRSIRPKPIPFPSSTGDNFDAENVEHDAKRLRRPPGLPLRCAPLDGREPAPSGGTRVSLASSLILLHCRFLTGLAGMTIFPVCLLNS